MKLILLWVWADWAVLGRANTALKFKNRFKNTPFIVQEAEVISRILRHVILTAVKELFLPPRATVLFAASGRGALLIMPGY